MPSSTAIGSAPQTPTRQPGSIGRPAPSMTSSSGTSAPATTVVSLPSASTIVTSGPPAAPAPGSATSALRLRAATAPTALTAVGGLETSTKRRSLPTKRTSHTAVSASTIPRHPHSSTSESTPQRSSVSSLVHQ